MPVWIHRILRNRFISDLRKQRPVGDIEDAPQAALAVPAAHEDSLVLQELHGALGRLPADQREALFLVLLQGMFYDEVSEATGSAVGTVKSRVFRARRQLESWLTGEFQLPVVTDNPKAAERACTMRTSASGSPRPPPERTIREVDVRG